MKIKPISKPYHTDDRPILFRMLVKKPIKKFYYPNCWNEVSEGKFKDYSFTVYNNYEFGKKGSTLIILKKLGTWIKSKLKYKDVDGKNKALWSYRDDSLL